MVRLLRSMMHRQLDCQDSLLPGTLWGGIVWKADHGLLLVADPPLLASTHGAGTIQPTGRRPRRDGIGCGDRTCRSHLDSGEALPPVSVAPEEGFQPSTWESAMAYLARSDSPAPPHRDLRSAASRVTPRSRLP